MIDTITKFIKICVCYLITALPLHFLDSKYNFKDKLIAFFETKSDYNFITIVLLLIFSSLLDTFLQQDLSRNFFYIPIIAGIGLGLVKW